MAKHTTAHVKADKPVEAPARKLAIRVLDKIETTKICTITGD
ncbi:MULTISPECIES: hypothetical protein [Glycomyces]|jgi:hypothetical protein|uniref:Uncharacterized protein n=2 Tax=Glycomyces TaxID=58113 RepID=A0A9X3PPP4_9ACTN|nr:hypothetical protein [Glycomyces lechevalierae]MDA1387558.1 hypothetical protein [Glycomyces lechevalierae]MDR7336676.1 hypothetical protein [Glycomyces lechevalierae]